MFLENKLIVIIGVLTIFFVSSSSCHAGQEGAASIDLPLSVKIIDFETTKKICGQDNNPPVWCPAHLLGGDEGSEPEFVHSSDYKGVDKRYRQSSLELRKLSKRERIAYIKANYLKNKDILE